MMTSVGGRPPGSERKGPRTEQARIRKGRERAMAPLAIMGLSIQELTVILLIILVLFGARRIPEIARGLGQGIRDFRGSLKGENDAESTNDEKEPAKTTRS